MILSSFCKILTIFVNHKLWHLQTIKINNFLQSYKSTFQAPSHKPYNFDRIYILKGVETANIKKKLTASFSPNFQI
jgi:hypothetical protein